MKELITRGQADAIFGMAIPLLGIVLAGIVFARARDKAAAVRAGGPLLLAGALWWVYNALTDRLGLDTVANLVVNLLLFLVVGAAVGLFWPRAKKPSDSRVREDASS